MACSNVSLVLDVLQIVYTLTLFTVAMGVFRPSCKCKNCPEYDEYLYSDTSSQTSAAESWESDKDSKKNISNVGDIEPQM